MMMLSGAARAATVLTAFGLLFNSFTDVYAIPQGGIARVMRSCTRYKTAALTFDDGPADYTREAMKILEDNGARGTFFVNGNNWGCIYDKADILKETYRRGHQIGSHTWSHGHLPTMSQAQIKQELTSAHAAIEKITGASVAFMRPPYGEYNDYVRQVAASLGETVITWDLDSGDSREGTSIQQQKDEYTNAVHNNMNSVLSLQHDVHPTSVQEVLPFAIKTLKDAGYRLVTVAECLGERPYSRTGKASPRTSDWHC